jgi:hypothetical protein
MSAMISLGKLQMLSSQAWHIIIALVAFRLSLFSLLSLLFSLFDRTINKWQKKRNQFLKSITTSIKMLLKHLMPL